MALSNLTNIEKLRRFLYTNATDCTYITGNPEPYLDGVDCQFCFHMAQHENADFIAVMTTCNEDKLLPRRKNLFYVLAYVLRGKCFGSVKESPEAAKTKALVLKFVRDDSEFFHFIKYYTQLNRYGVHNPKITTSLKKLVTAFYNKKSPREFVNCVTEFKGMHGWTHKDLIKLAHYKAVDPCCAMVVKYVLMGMKGIKDIDNPDYEWALTTINKRHELRTTMDAAKASSMIAELKAPMSLVNSKLHKNQDVWAALIPQTPIDELLRCLYKFYKWKWLTPNSPILEKCFEALNDPSRIAQSNVNPLQVYLALLNFSRGGKRMDPKLKTYLLSSKKLSDKKKLRCDEPKLPTVIHNLNRCLVISYNNVDSSDKRILISIDVNTLEETCFHNRLIKTIEATYSLLRYLHKVEKQLTIAAYQNNKIVLVDLKTKIKTSPEWIEKLLGYKCDYILPAAPFDWAIANKKVFDVFINILSVDWKLRVPTPERDKLISEWDALKSYRTEMKSEKTKLVRMFLGGHKTLTATGEKNALNIVGFTDDVPKVLEAFVTDRFQ